MKETEILGGGGTYIERERDGVARLRSCEESQEKWEAGGEYISEWTTWV